MSKLYLTATTDAIKTARTARAHHWARATLQSWEGSVQIVMDEHGNVDLYVEDGSTATPGHLLYSWSLADLLAQVK
jgi:hypothetical protein